MRTRVIKFHHEEGRNWHVTQDHIRAWNLETNMSKRKMNL
jgi:hypothetical protein